MQSKQFGTSGKTVILYLDSSCIVRFFIGDGAMLASWGRWLRAYTSELTKVEVRRALHRSRAERRITTVELDTAIEQLAIIEASIEFLPLAPVVLALAAEATPVVKTLDALHLATARQVRALAVPELVFATHDRQVAIAAAALGFPIEGVEFR